MRLADTPMSHGDLALVTMLARGYTTDLAAREMHLSPYTVRERISLLLDRFDCKNRAELVAYCYAHGLIAAHAWPPYQRPVANGPVRSASGRWPGMSFDALEVLKAAGQPIDLLSDGQRAVLASLTEDQVELLLSILGRLSAARGDVEAQEMKLL
jgi:DNA-binding CsgD family transcriptional regulator